MVKIKIIIFSIFLLGIASVGAKADYLPPSGGWTYIYNGDSAAPGTGGYTALDGTWSHDNGGDEWDETPIGAGRPGGAMTITDAGTSFLRMQDTGDPRDYGMGGDPGSNRKITFGHSITNDIGISNDAILDNGVIISFRTRLSTTAPLDDLHPDGGGGIAPWPAGGDGYVIHDGGMGNFSIHQSGGGSISFSLVLMSDYNGLQYSGLIMNNLNGNSPTADVDTGDAGSLNIFPISDLTDWHEFWITIDPDSSSIGTHLVKVYADDSVISNNFLVTAGTGYSYNDSYISLGLGSTGQSGAFDIDFFAYAARAMDPVVPVPGAFLLGMLGLSVAGVKLRKHS